MSYQIVIATNESVTVGEIFDCLRGSVDAMCEVHFVEPECEDAPAISWDLFFGNKHIAGGDTNGCYYYGTRHSIDEKDSVKAINEWVIENF